MPLNLPGLLVPLHLLVNPRLVLPALSVKDIRHLDFAALKRAGYRGAVFDKDNCLTLPHRDTLVPELQDAWQDCKTTFGDANVLIVSNSAGTASDTASIKADSVTYHLRAPVLRHASLKPSYRCIAGIRAYFASLPRPLADHELIVVGDRVFTDIVLANRMRSKRLEPARVEEKDATEQEPSASALTPAAPRPTTSGPLAVYTTGVWERESMLMRWAEKKLVTAVQLRTNAIADPAFQDFIRRDVKEPEAEPRVGVMERLLRRFRR